jgi:hippurate hydrolase
MTQISSDDLRPLTRDVLGLLDGSFAGLEEFYLDLHRNPELSGQEERTAARVASRLSQAGYTVTAGVGGHGVVGMLRNGQGPVVMLRGDMDALPIREDTGQPYASTRTAVDAYGAQVPVAHACGHDVHTTGLVGTAELLAAASDRWRGTVMAVAQPAEERLTGAAAMLADGLYSRFAKPDIALGQHVAPFPAGLVSHGKGVIMSAMTRLEVTISGQLGKRLMRYGAADPASIAASAITRLRAAAAQADAPAEVSIPRLVGRSQANIVDQLDLGLIVRSHDEHIHAQLVQAARAVLAEESAGHAETVIRVDGSTPANRLDTAAAERIRAAHNAWFGADRVLDAAPVTAAEDFAMYGAGGAASYGGAPVPAVFWFTGASPLEAWLAAPGDDPQAKVAQMPGLHSTRFLPDRVPTLRTAIEAMTVAALACLREHA